MSPRARFRFPLRRRARDERAPAVGAGVEGRVEGVVEGHAVGWVWDTGDASARLKVAVEIDEEVVAEGVAELERKDLLAAKIGEGAYGFRVALPESLQRAAYVQMVAVAGPDRIMVPKASTFRSIAAAASPWSGVRFGYGRGGGLDGEDEIRPEVPPSPERAALSALVGRDGWLFDAVEVGAESDPSHRALEALAARVQSASIACAELGMAYVLACVPEKLQAVPEGSPLQIDRSRPWIRGLVSLLRDVDDVEILDLLPVVDDARRRGRCFHKSDPNWNDLGAFFVARALIKEARKQSVDLDQLPLSGLHVAKRSGYRGVLADAEKLRLDGERWLPVDFEFTYEDGVTADASRFSAVRMPVERHLIGNGEVHVRLLAQPEAAGPRLAVVGDDASLPVLPWLAQTAARTTFFWSLTPPMEQIELEFPSAVFHLIRYRDLATLAVDQSSSS